MTDPQNLTDERHYGVDAQGNKIDLADFDEHGYRPGEVEEILEQYGPHMKGIENEEIVKGKIIKIGERDVIIDVGFKSEGIIPKDEFKSLDSYKEGDEVEVFVEDRENESGEALFSKSKADFIKVWDEIQEAYKNQTEVDGTIIRRIKGGMVVDVFGVDAFLPGSQIDLRPISDMDNLVGQTLKMRIIKVNSLRRNIVVSRRVILEDERLKMREEILRDLEKGDVREGAVKNITDFGAFIDLGGADGLLHITDMSWGRVNHPSEIVALGDNIKVKVIDFDDDKKRISLGLKQLYEHPWKDVETKYAVGTRVRGKIVSITDYGAFIELEKGIEGLIHISEMSWTEHIKHPSQVVGLGDIVEAVVLTLDKNNQKLSLGLKQLQPDPWKDIEEEFPIGSVVKGKIKSFAAFGAFVELKEGVDGLIHISDMSWTRKVNHPGEILKRNENVDVKVLGIDRDKRRMSLGIKQLQENPWPGLAEEFPVGKELEASISRILDRGLIVEVKPDVEGFIPLAQMGREIKKPSEVFTVGEKINAEVIEFDADDKRILLSVKEYYKDKDEQEWNAHCEKYPVRDAKPAEKETPADAASESDADQVPDAAQQSAPPAEAATSQQDESSSDDEDTQQQDEKDTAQE